MNVLNEIFNPFKLTDKEAERYSRHIVIPEVGVEGQLKLKNAKVLIVGAGGLGSPVGLYLAAAGVGTIGIADYDEVSFSNLQRQVLYNTDDVGMPKAAAAAAKLEAINPNVKTITHSARLTSENAMEIMRGYDIIADGSDNFATRYLVNDACVLLGKPVVYASILRFNGQLSFFDSTTGPCYRCLYPEPPKAGEVPSCEEGGVLGVLPGIIGSLQANELIKFILGKGNLLTGRLLMFDALEMSFKELKYAKDENCPICSDNATITELIDYDEFCNPSVEKDPRAEWEMNVIELKDKMDRGDKFILIDVREEYETALASIGGTLIPINTIPQKLEEKPFDKDAEIIVYCRTGNRSSYVVEYMRQRAGYTNVKNLTGGIYAWSDLIDSSVRKY